ncbi:MAG: hypothetical protein WA775_12695 [Psychroserpens sp.]|uniref:hypothetical protein n=1 Tax=Psychroserpens sp. TaxID=2020870 RepID=UPI003C76B6DD
MSKTINRIMQLVNSMNMSARQFDMSIDAANGYILRMQKNNASVGSDVIERIVKEYPQVNLVWLITGKGDMYIQNSAKPKARSKKEIERFIDQKLKSKWSKEKQKLYDEILKEMDSLNDK